MISLHFFYLNIIIHLIDFTEPHSNVALESFLTKNSSKIWLKNQTSIQPKNAYCSNCCVNIKSKRPLGRKCNVHTMCIYKESGYGPACKQVIDIGFTSEEIDVIVDAHNTLRNAVALGLEEKGYPGPQPPASNMRLMSWDEELANISQRWARQCQFAYDVCRDVDRFPVGQNIARGKSGVNQDFMYVLEWYNNVQGVNTDDIKSYRFHKDHDILSSHYTQLVWGDTYLVGCARVLFQVSDDAAVVYREHFICNYGPSGNIPDQPVYRIGEACTSCLQGTGCTNPDYPGLCGNQMVPMDKLLNKKQQRRKAETRQPKKVEIINGSNVCKHTDTVLVLLLGIVLRLIL